MSKVEINTQDYGFYVELEKNADYEIYNTIDSLLPLVKKNFTVVLNVAKVSQAAFEHNHWMTKILMLIFNGPPVRFVQIVNKEFELTHKIYNSNVTIVTVNSIQKAYKIVHSNKKYLTAGGRQNKTGILKSMWGEAMKPLKSVYQHIYVNSFLNLKPFK